jgi:hypothetical protein
MRKLRFTLAGLMVLVLVAAVGLAALRNASPVWVGPIFLLTRAVLGLAIINTIYRRGARRAWWLGFALFVCGYLALVEPRNEMRSPYLSTSVLLVAVKPYMGYPADPSPPTTDVIMRNFQYLKIGHDLWALVAGLFGGLLARIVYAFSADRSSPADAVAPATVQPSRERWLRPALIAWVGLVLATGSAAIRSGWDAGFWAGATFLLTCGLLGLACLGAIVGRGPRRPAWLGAGLLGGGYLLLVFAHTPHLPLPTGQFLNALREWIPAIAAGNATANARILHALEKPVPMTFPNPTPLSDVLKYVVKATATSNDPGIPIYLDPNGLQEVREASGTVIIDLRGVPLKTSLRLCLHQRDLDYFVKDGLVQITDRDDVDPPIEDPFTTAAWQQGLSPTTIELIADLEDPFLIVGHCLIALLAAGFGAVATPLIADACIRSASSPERT